MYNMTKKATEATRKNPKKKLKKGTKERNQRKELKEGTKKREDEKKNRQI